jgi:hypothetical protein
MRLSDTNEREVKSLKWSFCSTKLSVKLSQRQILTPGLVQMVSVLALNKLELKDMINTEMVENPVLEELEDAVPLIDDVGRKEEERDRVAAAATEENPVTAPETKDPFEEIDFGSFFQEYLDPGYRSQGEMEEIERPSFENFLSKPGNLTDHLIWQLGALGVRSEVREAAELVIGNLSEDGYLIASDEELMGTAAPASPEADAVTQQNLVKEVAALGLSATETETETEADMPGVASELEEQGADRSPAEDWDEYLRPNNWHSASDGAPGVAPPPPRTEVSHFTVEAATPTSGCSPSVSFSLAGLHEADIVRQMDLQVHVDLGNVCFTTSLHQQQLAVPGTAMVPLSFILRRECRG